MIDDSGADRRSSADRRLGANRTEIPDDTDYIDSSPKDLVECQGSILKAYTSYRCLDTP